MIVCAKPTPRKQNRSSYHLINSFSDVLFFQFFFTLSFWFSTPIKSLNGAQTDKAVRPVFVTGAMNSWPRRQPRKHPPHGLPDPTRHVSAWLGSPVMSCHFFKESSISSSNAVSWYLSCCHSSRFDRLDCRIRRWVDALVSPCWDGGICAINLKTGGISAIVFWRGYFCNFEIEVGISAINFWKGAFLQLFTQKGAFLRFHS